MQQKLLSQYSKHAHSVKELIAPLHAIGISGLFYVRIYTDGSIINLANNAYWTDFYFKQLETSQYQSKDISDQFFTYPGVSLWAFNENNPVWLDAKQYFGYRNGVLICEDHVNFREAIGFYSEKDDQQMNHFYVNQIDSLKRMKQYFTVQAHELINQAEHERVSLKHTVFSKIEPNSELQNLNTRFLQEEKFVVLIHKDTGFPIKLSPQRSQCFFNLLQGKSTHEIAITMQLSPKTIGHYLEMLRKELGCRSSKELILYYAHQVV